MRRVVIGSLLLLLFATPLAAQVVTCESMGGTYRECRVSSFGAITLVMEMSDGLCVEGRSWGTHSSGRVWVDRGCRAKFAIAGSNALQKLYGKDRIVCESQRNQVTVCTAESEAGVHLAQQLSKTPCVKGKNWDYRSERRQVWVDDGCRAEFALGPGSASQATSSLDATVICEPKDGRRTVCPADTSSGVQLVRELAKSICTFRVDWGYDAKGVWVDKGCRAEFAVRGKAKPLARALTCEAPDGERKHCEGETTHGVALVRQLGEAACVLGRSWGFDATGVWVSAGCRGQFALGGFRLPADVVPATAARVPCESIDGQRTVCGTDTSRGVGLIRQLADDGVCILNRTWGYDSAGIWVSGGCRAEFAVAR